MHGVRCIREQILDEAVCFARQRQYFFTLLEAGRSRLGDDADAFVNRHAWCQRKLQVGKRVVEERQVRSAHTAASELNEYAIGDGIDLGSGDVN